MTLGGEARDTGMGAGQAGGGFTRSDIDPCGDKLAALFRRMFDRSLIYRYGDELGCDGSRLTLTAEEQYLVRLIEEENHD